MDPREGNVDPPDHSYGNIDSPDNPNGSFLDENVSHSRQLLRPEKAQANGSGLRSALAIFDKDWDLKQINLNKDLINFDQDYQSTSDKDIIFNSHRVTHRKPLSIDTDNNSQLNQIG